MLVELGLGDVDLQWSTLEKRLREECNDEDEPRRGLAGTLAWADEHRVKARRDDVIHACWWLYATEYEAARSRWPRGEHGRTVLGTFEALDEDAALLFEYAARLDALLGSDWPEARFPADG